MVGGMVSQAWEMLMDLKDIVEIEVSTKRSEESFSYLESKIIRFLIITSCSLRFFQTSSSGPLVVLWTMSYEAKHSVFKMAVRDTHNFKNPLKTLESRIQG